MVVEKLTFADIVKIGAVVAALGVSWGVIFTDVRQLKDVTAEHTIMLGAIKTEVDTLVGRQESVARK